MVDQSTHALVGAVQRIAGAKTVGELTAEAARAARMLLGAAASAFVVREGGECVYVDGDGKRPPWIGKRYALEKCVCGWTIRNALPAIVPDVTSDARVPASIYEGSGVRSLLAVPIGDGEPIGALVVYWGELHAAGEEEVAVVRSLAHAAAVQMQNVRLMLSLERARTEAEKRAAENAALNERLRHALVEEKRVREWARESEDKLRAMADHVPAILWATDAAGALVYVNKRWEELTGLTAAASLGDGWRATIHPDDLPGVVASLVRATRARSVWTHEYRQRNGAGEHRWMIGAGVPSLGRDGGYEGMLGSALDITDRRRMEDALRASEERLQMLMRELDHRVKNNLAAVLSVCDQTFASTESMEGFRTAYRGRLQAMARTHEALASTKWTGARLKEMVATSLVAMMPDRSRRMAAEGEDVLLPAAAALPMAVTLHELATNALKYGAWSQASGAGKVEVRWTVSEPPRRLRMTWRESGGPEVRTPTREGFGMVLVQGMIEYELGGSVEVRFKPTGLECDIEVSLDSERVSARPLEPLRDGGGA